MHSARRTIASILAVGATTLALGLPVSADAATTAAPAAQVKKAKVKTTVKLTNIKVGKNQRVTFVGKVGSKKAACTKGRKVKLRQLNQKLNAGSDKTNKKGVWKIKFNGNKIHPGKFKITVAKKVVKKGGKKVVCKAASKKQKVS